MGKKGNTSRRAKTRVSGGEARTSAGQPSTAPVVHNDAAALAAAFARSLKESNNYSGASAGGHPDGVRILKELGCALRRNTGDGSCFFYGLAYLVLGDDGISLLGGEKKVRLRPRHL